MSNRQYRSWLNPAPALPPSRVLACIVVGVFWGLAVGVVGTIAVGAWYSL